MLQSHLLAALLAKRSRLTVLMADSCNTPGRFRVVSKAVVGYVTGPNARTPAELLFLGHTGVVNLNAAEVGKSAHSDVFAKAFVRTCNALSQDAAQLGQWTKFLEV
jgi:hypothetical protein